jgi:hypothetical protein
LVAAVPRKHKAAVQHLAPLLLLVAAKGREQAENPVATAALAAVAYMIP